MLYRLYLLWQRDNKRVVIIDGAAKPNSTALPDSFYDDLAALAATANDNPAPFCGSRRLCSEGPYGRRG